MIVGCNLDVPGIAGTPQGSVLVMTDVDWAADVKDRRSYSGIAVWVKGSVENIGIPCMCLPRSRTWFVSVLVNPSRWHLLVELARVSQRETNGASCANAHLDDYVVH